jgi:hypothetical protein
MGWKGPYINTGASGTDALHDAFGRQYRGAATGRVSSAGPDGLFDTADDIVYPPAPPNPGGRLMVTVKRMAAEDNSYTLDPAGYTVRLYYSNNGQEAFLDDPVAPFVFENVPQGIHAVVVLRMKTDPPRAVAQDTIQVFGNGATKLEEFVSGAVNACYTRPFTPGRNRPGGFAVFDPLRVRGPGADPGVPGG